MILLINSSRIFYFTDKLWSMFFKAQHFWSILTLHFLTHYVFVNPKQNSQSKSPNSVTVSTIQEFQIRFLAKIQWCNIKPPYM